MPEATAIRPFSAASFKQYLAEHKLMTARCTDCGALYLPPRPICPSCHSENLEWMEVPGKGRLAGFTIIYVAPTFMVKQGFGRENPYVTGIVEIEQGALPVDTSPLDTVRFSGRGSTRISARISGVDPNRPQDIRVGMPLEIDFIESQDETPTTYLAFRPVETGS